MDFATLSIEGDRHAISGNENASRYCFSNGTWAGYTNYTLCLNTISTQPPQSDQPEIIEISSTLYYAGYSLSLVALIVAISIFLYFKDLRCLRNTIHTNLMCTFLLVDFMWIFTLTLQLYIHTDTTLCIFLTLLLHYFHISTFFWMFVEGLYLYMLVVATFTGENIKLRVYVVIGWGTPVLIVVIWGLVKSFAPNISDAQVQSPDNLIKHCPWMVPDHYDWIFEAPTFAVLAINLVFLIMIMWVLITKLRSANTVETEQYRKATKALLVLIPLLGITHIVMLTWTNTGASAKIYAYIRSVLISTQGFTVALFYCFLNTEVQNTVRHHVERWKTARSLGGSRRYNYNYSSHSKDWSPRSRTESIRLYSSQPAGYRKRESTVSETTTTTLLGPNMNNGGGSRLSNGSSGPTVSTVKTSVASPLLNAENAV
ncbi:diuretic hormone receptor-like [Anabrus simplex]|uniref:diuretic hormone receptor-like n=1 Tax=Anabrus simplex TaxID=316456 RepID=UPI0034DD78C8